MNFKNVLLYISVIFLIIVLGLKIGFLFKPIGTDEALVSVFAQNINSGKILYVDLFDHKPPFSYYPLAWVYKIFGSSQLATYLLAFLYELLFLLSIFLITKKLLDNKSAIIATAISSVLLIATELTSERPMTILGLWAIYLYLITTDKKNKMLLFFSGILIGLSVWFKQPGILFLIAIIVHQFYLSYKKQQSTKISINNNVLVILGFILINLPLMSYFIYKIGFNKLFFAVITFNILFSGSASRIFTIGKLFFLIISMFSFLIPLIIFHPKKSKIKTIFITYFITLFLFFLINKEIFEQHLIQAIPFIAIFSVYSLHLTKNIEIKKIFSVLIILFFLFSFLTFLNTSMKTRHSNEEQIISEIKQIIPEDSKIFSGNPRYSYLLEKYENDYKIFFLSPPTASVFDLSDFCDYSLSRDYLVLTHRKQYLGEENLNCIENFFELEKRFNNADEYFLEIWKNKKIKNGR